MKLDNQTVARRYGKALFDVSLEKNTREQLSLELSELKKFLHNVPQFKDFISSNAIKPDAKTEMMKTLTKDTSDLLTNLLNMLYDYKRLTNLEDIINEFDRLNDEFEKTVRATVTTAIKLDEDQKKRLESSFANVVGANKVIFNQKIDESIIGGVILKSESYIYDGSIKSKIERIKRLLLK